MASLACSTPLASVPFRSSARCAPQMNRPLGRRPVVVRAGTVARRPTATKAPRRAASQQTEPPASAEGGVLGVLNSIVTHPFIASGTAIDKLLRLLSCLALCTAANGASKNFDMLAADPVYFTFIGFLYVLTMLQLIAMSLPGFPPKE